MIDWLVFSKLFQIYISFKSRRPKKSNAWMRVRCSGLKSEAYQVYAPIEKSFLKIGFKV